MIHELAEHASSDLSGSFCPLDAGIGDEAGNVELVSAAGLYRGTLLEREKIVEPLDVVRAATASSSFGSLTLFCLTLPQPNSYRKEDDTDRD